MPEQDLENIQNKSKLELELAIEKYRKYFDIIRRNEAQMINGFPSLESLGRGTLPSYRSVAEKAKSSTGKEWLIHSTVPILNKEEAIQEFFRRMETQVKEYDLIKNVYDSINLDEQDENTGATILRENKDLINKFDPLFREVMEEIKQNPESPVTIPEELFKLRDTIMKNSYEYGELPAVQAYLNSGFSPIPEGMLRSEYFTAGKPTRKEWFEKWFGSERKT